MGSGTYSTRGIVLRKTKLGESDLVITLLNADGSLLRCVAKGARKPTSSFSSRLELFSEVELLCARGRSLDLVKESKLVSANSKIRVSVEHMTAASPIAELLSKIAQEGLENRVLYDSASVAFSVLNDCDNRVAPAVCGAYLLKALAYVGLKPSLSVCVGCAEAVDLERPSVAFSFSEGGVTCDLCRPHCETMAYPSSSVMWGRYFLASRFAEIVAQDPPLDASFAVLRLSQGLIKVHVGGNLKSLEFMLSCGLYG